MSTNDRNVSLLTTLLGVVAALLVMLTLGTFLQGWTLRQMAEEERTKIFERPYPELETYTREREQWLAMDYQWIDEDAGIVRLPIERAMALVVEELGADPRASTALDPSASVADAVDNELAETELVETELAAAGEVAP